MVDDAARRTVRALVAAQPVGPSDEGVVGWLQRLCRSVVDELPAAGAGVSIIDRTGFTGVVAASDQVARSLEDLQFTMGEGPCLDAYASGSPVLQPDLEPTAATRWPAYSGAVHAHGVRAVFAVPLQVGATRLGVLDFYRTTPGRLSAPALELAQAYADVAVEILVDGQAHAGPGHADGGLETAAQYRDIVYQAQGMTMVALDVTLAEALVRLRAHAYALGRPISDVAADVVATRLHLPQDASASPDADASTAE